MGSRAQGRCEQCWQLVWPWNLCERDKYRIPKTQSRWVRGVWSFRLRFCVPPVNVTKNEKTFLHCMSTAILIAHASSNREFSKLEGTAQEVPRMMEQSWVSFSRLFLIYNGLWLTE